MAGIYIHIPFCSRACTYCNFHFSTSLKQKDALISAIVKEISLQKDFISDGEKIETIYFGGGTPSILEARELTDILESVHKQFEVLPNAEVTLEANPENISETTLMNWKSMGINRLSVGIQSFYDAELKWMNRLHTSEQAIQCLQLIEKAGFDNFSADLIYGSPLLSDEQWLSNVENLLAFSVPHVSAYALTVEEKTKLAYLIKTGKSSATDAEKQARQFEILCETLEKKGFQHYEISNFAKHGFESVHNKSYWEGKPYYGLGPGAHAYDGKNKRRWNIANNALYISSIAQGIIPFEEEVLTTTQQINEMIMIRLRTSSGLDIEAFKTTFGNDEANILTNNIAKHVASGTIQFDGQFYIITKKGKFLADGIAADLFV